MARPRTPESEHLWPNDVADNPMVQDALDEYYDERHKLSAIWKNRYDATRADVDEDDFVSHTLMDTVGADITPSEISSKIRLYIESKLKFGIYKYLSEDPGIRKYLGEGYAGGISVNVSAGDRLAITVRGPSWLKFYFSGWRTYRVSAPNNVASRGHLVFYGSSGYKIVTKSVVVPGHPPGLYIEQAVKDLETELPGLVEQEYQDVHLEDEYDDDIAFASEMADQDALEQSIRELHEEQENLRNLKLQIANLIPAEELRQIYTEIDNNFNAEISLRQHLMREARTARKFADPKNKPHAGLILNEAIQRYLEAYSIGVLLNPGAAAHKNVENKLDSIAQTNPSRSAKVRIKKIRNSIKK